MVKSRWYVPSTEWRLLNLKSAGFNPKKIIDIGAYKGDWGSLCKKIFPEASILLLEGQKERESGLSQFCKTYPDCKYKIAVLGSQKEEKLFVGNASNSRIVSHSETQYINEKIEKRRVEILSELAVQENFGAVDLIKIDVQGHELEVLKGAGALFGETEVIVLEVSTMRTSDIPIFDEVLNLMRNQDYVLYDILELNYRPRDMALWQADVMFVKKESQLLSSCLWD